MNRLPRVLLNEINEFALGDRKYYKIQYNHVIDQLDYVMDRAAHSSYFIEKPLIRTSRYLLRFVKLNLEPSFLFVQFKHFLRTKNVSLFCDSKSEYITIWNLWTSRKFDEFFANCPQTITKSY